VVMNLEEPRPFGGIRLRIPPRAFDQTIVVVLGVGSALAVVFGEAPEGRAGLRWIAVVLAIAQAVPLWWRRRRPALVLLLCWIATILYYVLDLPENAAIGLGTLIATYSIAAYGTARESVIGGVASVAVITALTTTGVLIAAEPKLSWGDVVFSAVFVAAVWLVGENVHVRRLRAAALEERAQRLKREAQLESARAAADERARIARELHDVVAHAVSTIVIQAGGARRVIASDREQAKRALEVIETTGRDALGELRRVLGVLRSDGASELEPQPGLALLDSLVQAVRKTGLPIEVETRGVPFALPAVVDLSAYRIVQEALTNVVKHAGEARVRVLLTYEAGRLDVEVSDDGRGAAAELRDGGAGHGLVGMRERVALLGGELTTRPRSGGGFEIRARLPVGDRP
jgi:signal transduction histidine kinase